MDLILIGFIIAFLGVIGALMVFSVAMREQGRKVDGQSSYPVPVRPAETFFFPKRQPPARRFPDLTPQEILDRLERHFLFEEGAILSFLEGPSIESLHAPSSATPWIEGGSS